MKTAKRLLTLALALCMVIGIPFAVSAADDDFQLVSAVEAPYTYNWESVVWDNTQTDPYSTKSAADFKAKWLGKAVIVTFNHQLHDDTLEALKSATCQVRFQAKGYTGDDFDGNLGQGRYLGHIDKTSIVLVHSLPGVNDDTNANRTFDMCRKNYNPSTFVVSFSGTTTVEDRNQTVKDVDENALWRNPGHQFTITERNPLTVESVTPLADSKITNETDKGRIWLVKFNQNIDPSIKTSNGKILMWVTDANGDRLNGDFETCRIVANYCSDTVLAIRPNSATYTVSYYEDLAAQHETTIGGYGVEFIDGLGSSNRNNCVDSILSVSGETLPLITKSNSGDSWISAMYEPFGAKIGDVNYRTFAEAMAAATAGNTVTMLNDAVASDEYFMLKHNIKLNLNGYELTVNNYFMPFGQIVDTTDGEGKLVIAKDKVRSELANETYLPLYDTNGYRFFNYEFRHVVKEEEATKHVYSIALFFKETNARAYDLLIAEDNADMDFGVEMTIVQDGEEKGFRWIVSNARMQQFAEKNEGIAAGSRSAITLTLTGIDKLGEATITSKQAIFEPEAPVGFVHLAGDLVPEVA